MQIRLPYGKDHLTFTLPDKQVLKVLRPAGPRHTVEKTGTDIVKEALQKPVSSPRLRDLAKGKKNIVLIASDHTRPVPTRIIFPLLFQEIKKGNPSAHLTVLIATGCHRDTTAAELEAKFGPEYIHHPDIAFLIHHSRTDEMVTLGTLPSGGILRVNRLVTSADLLISEGFIEPHFFAGFSGGRKSILPGICSAETVAANHCAAFIADPHARTGVLKDNPIHRDMVYAAKKAGLAFIVNVVLDEKKDVIFAVAGDPFKAHEKGCAFVDEIAGTDPEPADIVITTNGGYPLDQNIYQSVKGMTAAEATCKEGGVIIICADASDGHGGDSFFRIMNNDRPLEGILREFMATPPEKTIPDQWQAQIFIRILMHHKVIMVTNAPCDIVESLRMTYASSPEEALLLAKQYIGNDTPTYTVIPDGVSVIVRS